MKIKIKTQKLHKYIKLLSDVRVIGLLAFFAVVLLVAFSSVKVLQSNFELQKKENELIKINEVKKLETQNLKLKNVYLESDEYLELTARRQFGKALPGEKLYIIPQSVALAEVKDINNAKGKKNIQQKIENKPTYQKNIEDWKNFILHKN